MMEFVKHIAEVEGVMTPTKKRSKKEIETAFKEFTEKRAKTKKAKAAKTKTATAAKGNGSAKKPPAKFRALDADTLGLVAESVDAGIAAVKANGSAKKPPAKAAEKPAKPAPVLAEPIPMNHISKTGYVREVAFDPKSKTFYIAFAKSTWAFPATAEEWKAFEAAVADPKVDIDSYYRKAFRGRTASMIPVKSGAEKSAPKSEVK